MPQGPKPTWGHVPACTPCRQSTCSCTSDVHVTRKQAIPQARRVRMPILKLFLRHVTFICLYSSYLSGHVTFVCLYSGYLSRHVHQSTHLSLTRKHIHTLMHRQPHTGQAAPHKHKHIHTHTHVDMRLHTQAHTHLSQHKAQLIHIFQAETTAAQVQQHHISTVQLNRFNGLVLLFIVIP